MWSVKGAREGRAGERAGDGFCEYGFCGWVGAYEEDGEGVASEGDRDGR